MIARIFLSASIVLLGCQSPVHLETQPVVLTDSSEIMEHIGQIVTIRGMVLNSKIPMILGVDVRSFNPDLRGKYAEATGVLDSWTVTREQLDESEREYGPIANRGPGIFVRLKALDSNYNAQVREVLP